MRAGALRNKVAIQEQEPLPDGMGGFGYYWTDISGLGSVPAAIWPISGQERFEGLALRDRVTHQIRIRYVSGLSAKHRIVYGTEIYNIVALINKDELNKVIDMLAEYTGLTWPDDSYAPIVDGDAVIVDGPTIITDG